LDLEPGLLEGLGRLWPETTPLFFRLAREAEVVLDVGAYVGFFAELAGLANRQARIFAFEPMPENAERLHVQVELNGLSNVESVPAAVSDADGTAKIFHAGSGFECSTSLSREFMSSHREVRASTGQLRLTPFSTSAESTPYPCSKSTWKPLSPGFCAACGAPSRGTTRR